MKLLINIIELFVILAGFGVGVQVYDAFDRAIPALLFIPLWLAFIMVAVAIMDYAFKQIRR